MSGNRAFVLLRARPSGPSAGLGRHRPFPSSLGYGHRHPVRGLAALTPASLALAKGVLRGDRLSLSRAITLIESSLDSHRLQAEELLDYVVRERGSTGPAWRKASPEAGASGRLPLSRRPTCLRIGVAGPPGAGKSTFIEAMGKHLIQGRGMRVAVIAVDPSSSRSGGSILGDKTRMMELARNPKAFVRACPTSGVLGGVARYTNDVVLLCMSAGFDVVFIETVGLGQSEIMIDEASDLLLLLVPPGGGDELQGVKKGIMEVADVIVVNKADGSLLQAAQHTAAEYTHALHFQRRKWSAWSPSVTLCSALQQARMEEVWAQVEKCGRVLTESGDLQAKRREQGRYWMWNSLQDQLVRRVKSSPAVLQAAAALEQELVENALTPRSAADRLIDVFVRSASTTPQADGGVPPQEEQAESR